MNTEPTHSKEFQELKYYLDNYFIMSTSDMKASKVEFFNGLYERIHAIEASHVEHKPKEIGEDV